MGNIVIANMQATLTLDNREFEERLAASKKELSGIEERVKNLPGGQSDNLGQHAQDAERQQDALVRAQEVQLTLDGVARISAAHTEGANLEEAAHRRRRAASDVSTQAQVEGLTRVGAAADAVNSKHEQTLRLQDQIAERIQEHAAAYAKPVEQAERVDGQEAHGQPTQPTTAQSVMPVQPHALRDYLRRETAAHPPDPALLDKKPPFMSWQTEWTEQEGSRIAAITPLEQREGLQLAPAPASPHALTRAQSLRPLQERGMEVQHGNALPAFMGGVMPYAGFSDERLVNKTEPAPVPATRPATAVPPIATPPTGFGHGLDMYQELIASRDKPAQLMEAPPTLATPATTMPPQLAQKLPAPMQAESGEEVDAERIAEERAERQRQFVLKQAAATVASSNVQPNAHSPQYVGPGARQVTEATENTDKAVSQYGNITDDLAAKVRELVAKNAGNLKARDDALLELGKSVGGQAPSMFEYVETAQKDYDKQQTPEYQKKQRMEGLRSQIREAQGIPDDPEERLKQRLEKLTGQTAADDNKGDTPTEAYLRSIGVSIEEDAVAPRHKRTASVGAPGAPTAATPAHTTGGATSAAASPAVSADPDAGGRQGPDHSFMLGEEERVHSRGGLVGVAAQRYEFLQSEGVAPVRGFLEALPGGTTAINAMAALATPALAATAAATALGLGLSKAAEATEQYAQAQFREASTLSVAGGGNYAVTKEFQDVIEKFTAGAAKQAISPQDMKSVLTSVVGEGLTKTGIEQLEPYAVALQHQGGMSFPQAMEGLTGAALRGDTSPFMHFGAGQIAPQGSVEEVMRVLQPMLAQDASYTRTIPGMQAQIGADISGMGPAIGKAVSDFLSQHVPGVASVEPATPGVTYPWDHRISAPVMPITAAPTAPATQPPATLTVPGMTPALTPAASPTTPTASTTLPQPMMPSAGGTPVQRPLIEQGQLPASADQPNTSNFSQGDLVQGAVYQLTAMRQISEEVSDSESAISGIQKVFSELTTEHVTWSQVQPQLDDLEHAIVELQKWWVRVANSQESQVKSNAYAITDSWLKVTGSMVQLMAGSSDAFAKLFQNGGAMPTEAQQDQLVARLRGSFDTMQKIALAVYGDKGTPARDLNVQEVQGWATAMQAIVNILSTGSDAEAKIYALPIPDAAQSEQAAERIAGMIGSMDNALIKVFEKEASRPAGFIGPMQGVIDSKLGTAAQMAEGVNKILGMANTGLDGIRKMSNLYVPSPEETKAILDKVMGIGDTLSQAMEDQLGKAKNGGLAIGTIGPPSAAGAASQADPVLKSAGERADNLNKLMGLANTGVSGLRAMTNLYVPDDAEIERAISGVFTSLDKAMDHLPPHDPNKEAKVKLWGESLAPLAGVLSTSVGMIRGMTDLYVPSPAEIDRVITGVFEAVDGALGHLPAYNEQQAIQVKERGEALAAVAGFVGAGVQDIRAMTNLYVPSASETRRIMDGVFRVTDEALAGLPAFNDQQVQQVKGRAEALGAVASFAGAGIQDLAAMRNLSVPSESEIKRVIIGTFGLVSGVLADMPAYNPQVAAQVKERADALAAVVNVASGGVSALKNMRDLAEPSEGQMASFRKNLGGLIHSLDGIDQSLDPQQASRVADWGNAISAEMGAITGVAGALQGIRDVRLPSERETADFKRTMENATAAFMPDIQGTSQEAADNAKDWGNGMQAQYQALGAGVDWLAKMHDLFLPSKGYIDSIYANEKYIADQMIAAAQKLSPEQTKAATEYGQAQAASFDAVSKGADTLSKVMMLSPLSTSMIDSYFKNLDTLTEDYAARAEEWVKKQRFENSKFSVELGAEIDALSKVADLQNKFPAFRIDYRGQINMLFTNLDLMLDEFAIQAKQHKSLADERTHMIAVTMGDEMDAVSKALDPLAHLPEMGMVQPGLVTAAFRNVQREIQEFAGLADMPELQGENMAKLTSFAGSMNGIFGAIKSASDTVLGLNASQLASSYGGDLMTVKTAVNGAIDPVTMQAYDPGPVGGLGGGDFTSSLETFFMQQVPNYADEWVTQMQKITDSTGKMADAVTGDFRDVAKQMGMPATDVRAAVRGKTPDVSVPAVVRTGTDTLHTTGTAKAGGGDTYTNCLFIAGVQVSKGQTVEDIVSMLAAEAHRVQGGIPVNDPQHR